MAAPRTYLRADTRRTQLVELGLTLFGKHAYEDVSIDEVARRAGMSKGLLYHYFGSKRGFFNEVMRSAAAELTGVLKPDPALSGPANVRRGLLAWFAFVDARADAYLALMSGGVAAIEGVGPIMESVREQMVRHIVHGLGLRRAPPAFRIAARSWVGAAEAAACDWLAHRDVPAEVVVDLLVASLFGAIVAAQRSDPSAGVRLDLSAGFAALAGVFSIVPSAAPAKGPATATQAAVGTDDVSRESASRPASGSRGSRRPRRRRSSP